MDAKIVSDARSPPAGLSLTYASKPDTAVLLTPGAALMTIILLSLALWAVIWLTAAYVASARLW